MNDDTALMDSESIKQLKARYCRYLDTKDRDRWRDLFTDDFVGDTTQAGGTVIVGADEFIAYTRRWRIKTSNLTGLREDLTTPMFAPPIAARLRAAAAKIARCSAD